MQHRVLNVAPKIRLEGADGASIELDLQNFKASAEQKELIKKFLDAGDIDVLTDDELAKIKDLKATVGIGSDPEALIVRFDATWVRID